MAAALTGCHSRTSRYCVDATPSVADDQDGERKRAGHHWYFVNGYRAVRNGTRLQGGSTAPPVSGFRSQSSGATEGGGAEEGAGSVRGGIGAAGEAAGAHGAGGGE